MRFIDEAKIKVTAGHGGRGCVSFRREKYVPRGGPDGGDGGDGGDFYFVASSQLGTLQDFRFRRVYQAPNGKPGAGANKAGKDGEDVVVRVPVGTVIKNADSGEILADLTEDNQKWLGCAGGRGGKGNAHFVTSTFQAPKFAQEGEPGEAKEFALELKLLAHAAIVGFPNAGKSTLISRISAARPKIADYPFTTLTPNLGVVSLSAHGLGDSGAMHSFVVADIPGLIEGAHRGLGLGHRFLKHIERTRVIVHLLDSTVLFEGEDTDAAIERLTQRYQSLREELRLFSPLLVEKPELLALSKADALEGQDELVSRARAALLAKVRELRSTEPLEGEPFLISAVSGTGIKTLIGALRDAIVRQEEQEEPAEQDSPEA